MKKTYPTKQQEEYNGSRGAAQSFLTTFTATTRKNHEVRINRNGFIYRLYTICPTKTTLYVPCHISLVGKHSLPEVSTSV